MPGRLKYCKYVCERGVSEGREGKRRQGRQRVSHGIFTTAPRKCSHLILSLTGALWTVERGERERERVEGKGKGEGGEVRRNYTFLPNSCLQLPFLLTFLYPLLQSSLYFSDDQLPSLNQTFIFTAVFIPSHCIMTHFGILYSTFITLIFCFYFFPSLGVWEEPILLAIIYSRSFFLTSLPVSTFQFFPPAFSHRHPKILLSPFSFRPPSLWPGACDRRSSGGSFRPHQGARPVDATASCLMCVNHVP